MKHNVKKVLFLTKQSGKTTLSQPHYVVLSPEYYWVKKVTIPVSSVYQARSYAPAVMDDLLPAGGTYSYDVHATGEKSEFVIVAYERAVIVDVIGRQISGEKYIDSIYWAQRVLEDMQGCIAVDRKQALLKIEDIIVMAPIDCDSSSAVLGEALRSGNYTRRAFALHSWTDRFAVGEKILRPAVMLLALFAATTILSYAFHRYQISKVVQQREQLQMRYHLPATSFQVKSILSGLIKKDKRQRALRAMLQTLSDAPFPADSYVKELRYGNGSLLLRIVSPSKTAQKALSDYFQKKGAKTAVKPEDGEVRVELTYE